MGEQLMAAKKSVVAKKGAFAGAMARELKRQAPRVSAAVKKAAMKFATIVDDKKSTKPAPTKAIVRKKAAHAAKQETPRKPRVQHAAKKLPPSKQGQPGPGNGDPAVPANRPPAPVRDEFGRFPPGVSGNPNGRPKNTPVTDAFRALLAQVVPGDPEGRSYAELIALATIRSAMMGSVESLRELTDRVEGKARQSIALTGRDGGPIDVANLTPEQRDAELAQLAAELGYRREE